MFAIELDIWSNSCQLFKAILVRFSNAGHAKFVALSCNDLNMVSPVGRQVRERELAFGCFNEGEPLILMAHFLMPHPKVSTASVHLTSEVEIALHAHHRQHAAGQRGVYRMVFSRDFQVRYN